jgi:hypothetical protein
MPKRRILRAIAVALVVIALAFAGLKLWDRAHRTPLREAVDAVPRDALRVSFTDWEAVRKQLDVHGTGTAAAERLGSRGYDSDLSSVSSIDESTAALQKHFGFSPLTIQWEAYAQSKAGSAMVVRMPGGFDFGHVRDHLADLGFKKPKNENGVWNGGVDLVASIDPTITPELQYVVVLAGKHLIVTSDTAQYAKTATAAALGKQPSLGDVGSVRTVVAKTGKPAAAMVWSRDFVCTDLAMSQADPDSQQQAQAAIAAAGKTSPLTGMSMALSADRRLSVVQLFESSAQAKENLGARAKLAVGPAIGLGGSFGDDMKLTSSRTDGNAVLLGWKPKEKTGFLLSAYDDGPIIFATC